jgi:hypothetical protein
MWPRVTERPMFGFRAFFRGTIIFAMFPDKQPLENPAAIAYKLHDKIRQREGEKWHLFELNEDRSVADAISILEKAYSRAK